jgi:acetyl-CoA carboxylase biotin carboxyl carrier protein
MTLTQDDVLQILKLIDQAPVGHFRLQLGDLQLEVAKGDGPAALPAIQQAPAPAATAPSAQIDKPAAAPAAVPALVPSVPVPRAGAATIKAPILGIFYRRPQPGVPAFVEEGSIVEEDTTVALLEVMKLFHQVKAGVRGRIVRICVEDGALVEHGQELFQVEPL